MAIVTEADSPVALPERYAEPWRDRFYASITPRLSAGMSILDVGSGRNPSLVKAERPERALYAGLDLSAEELAAAGPGAYDESIVADATAVQPALAGRFDLVLSWQVLEHVKPLPQAMDNFHLYLKPGGVLVALFSGSWSAFGIANRVLPDRVGSELVGRVMRRRNSDRPVFPAHYDGCHASALRTTLADWSSVEITPLYRGASYFHFSSVLSRLYLAYENRAKRRGMENLATHYLLVATR